MSNIHIKLVGAQGQKQQKQRSAHLVCKAPHKPEPVLFRGIQPSLHAHLSRCPII